MMVIPIIGVRAAIAVPNFEKTWKRAAFAACYANQKTIAGAREMYALDKNLQVPVLEALGKPARD